MSKLYRKQVSNYPTETAALIFIRAASCPLSGYSKECGKDIDWVDKNTIDMSIGDLLHYIIRMEREEEDGVDYGKSQIENMLREHELPSTFAKIRNACADWAKSDRPRFT